MRITLSKQTVDFNEKCGTWINGTWINVCKLCHSKYFTFDILYQWL